MTLKTLYCIKMTRKPIIIENSQPVLTIDHNCSEAPLFPRARHFATNDFFVLCHACDTVRIKLKLNYRNGILHIV